MTFLLPELARALQTHPSPAASPGASLPWAKAGEGTLGRRLALEPLEPEPVWEGLVQELGEHLSSARPCGQQTRRGGHHCQGTSISQGRDPRATRAHSWVPPALRCLNAPVHAAQTMPGQTPSCALSLPQPATFNPRSWCARPQASASAPAHSRGQTQGQDVPERLGPWWGPPCLPQAYPASRSLQLVRSDPTPESASTALPGDQLQPALQ